MKLPKWIFVLLAMPLVFVCAQSIDDSLIVVKEIRISGNDVTKEYVIRREMKLHARGYAPAGNPKAGPGSDL